MSIILHIGLHKTASKYFQHHVFPFLESCQFLYNPPKLDQLLLDYLKADESDRAFVLKYLKQEVESLTRDNPGKKILLSREAMSGNLFSGYKYWNLSIGLLKIAFPNAKIVIFLRNQLDWLISCYRESIHEHHYQAIEDFICFDRSSASFFAPKSSRNRAGFANLNALGLDYPKMLSALFNLFGDENVSTFFFEDFKKNPDKITADLLRCIGSDYLDIKPYTVIPNRGYSALSIELSIKRFQIAKTMGVEGIIHRPIFFYGKGSIPAGNISLSILDKSKYWGSYFLRDNEEIRSPDYPERTDKEQVEYEASWRYIVKHVLDRADYVDWDLLNSHARNKLEDHYRIINQQLSATLNYEEIPSEYY